MKFKIDEKSVFEDKAFFDGLVIDDKRLFDKRSIEVYEYVIKNHVPVTLRNGNWAQEFYRLDEMLIYINAQFSDLQFVERVLTYKEENDGE